MRRESQNPNRPAGKPGNRRSVQRGWVKFPPGEWWEGAKWCWRGRKDF